MRIGIIGELDGDERLYGRLADKVGHEARFHGGKGHDSALDELLEHSDVVVLLTPRSAVTQLTRRRLKQRGLTPLVLPRCGVAQFTALLEALNARAQANC
jgi:phosphoglycerate dehydrogenase-like enzyme